MSSKEKKSSQPDPWDALGEEIKEGSVVKGRIVDIKDYGAILEILPGVEGLILVPEVTWSNRPINTREYFKINQKHEAKIITLDIEERRMYLSLKQLTVNPWNNIIEKYPLKSRHTGEVIRLMPFGVFVELEYGIGGLIHLSNLSWTEKYTHSSEFIKKGKRIEVIILNIDIINRKLYLGHKQLEESS